MTLFQRFHADRSLQIAANNAMVDSITVETVSALRDSGVDCILLKGPSFSRWLYPGQFVRTYVDTDLLVAIGMMQEVNRALRQVGFSLSKPTVDLPYDRPAYVLDWLRPRDAAVIEIHRTLVGIRADPNHVWAVLSRQTEGMSLQGIEMCILNQPARCLHVALHAAQDGGRVGKAMEDLKRAAALVSLENWEAAARLAVALDAADAFAFGLRLAPESAKIATSLGLPVTASVDVLLHAENRAPAARSIDWWLRIPGVKGKTRLAVAKLFPPPSFMRTWSALARRGRAGLVLAYPWRLLWLLAHGIIGVITWSAVRFRRRGS
jgi:hypothetical protein